MRSCEGVLPASSAGNTGTPGLEGADPMWQMECHLGSHQREVKQTKGPGHGYVWREHSQSRAGMGGRIQRMFNHVLDQCSRAIIRCQESSWGMEGSTPEVLLGREAFVQDHFNNETPKIDSTASLMAASKLEVAWQMLEGGQVRRT